MKKIILLFVTGIALQATAQNVKLKTGQTIKNVTVFTLDMDMGMGGQAKVNSETTSDVTVTGMDGAAYTGTATVTRLKMTSEGGGQEASYDSDKKEDADSDMGKSLSKTVQKINKISIGNETGKVTLLEKEEKSDSDNPMDMFTSGNSGDAGATAGGAFFVIPAGKKPGDSWSETTDAGGMKSANTFQYTSLTGDRALINIKTKTSGTVTKEANGMSIDVTMNTDQTGTMEVNANTAVVIKRNIAGDMSGSMEVMGQSLPITGKTMITSTFQ